MAYVELHCHSAFSFLDGASLPDELATAAVERGHRALALTDHDSVSGSMEFAQAARDAGLRAIHGAEVTVREAPGDGEMRHLTLLVRDARGWTNLCRLLTRAHAHTRHYGPGPAFHEPGRAGPPEARLLGPRRSRDPMTRTSRVVGDPSVTLEDVEAHAEGLVCLSGCARHGVRDLPTLRRLLRAFGRDAFRIELQRPFLRHDRALNRSLQELAARLRVPCVATGDVHAHTPARARLQDAFVAIREHTTLDASEPLRRGNHSHVLATPEAMAARFADHPAAVAESERLADSLRFDLTHDLGYRYPGADDAGADRRLAEICHGCFESRYPVGSSLREQAAARLEEELELIASLGLSGFFLLHREMLELAREVAVEVRGPDTARALLPPGRGRGSSVSSIVCHLTGLSHIDPIANRLLLGRFLNEDISTLPDIDLDFPRDVREVLIPRVHDRFGRDRAALVAAFPTFRARGAIRELGKVLGLAPGEIERVARGSEGWNGGEVGRDIATALGSGREAEGRWRWLAELSWEAFSLPRHLSQHSGGMIVATHPLVDCCPVVPAAMEGRQMVMWDKDSCSDAGFLKIDLLGLGMLSAVERCVELIATRRGERIDLSRIPFDDPATFEAIQEAETTGVFQIESRAQMGSLRRTRPENLDDLTVQVAIVRPGPIQGGAVNPYIERRQHLRENPAYEVPYDHPSLRPVLGETLGTIIFQDQVIEVAMAFAGFAPGQAESLRRAMSRKRSAAAIEAHHRSFVEGAMATWPDVDEALAERVWSMVVGFSGFGFPKAHGAAFGLLAYQSTWLRVHYGAEFLCSLLDEQPMGFYPPDALIHEAQRRDIEILAPDVNASEVECTVVDAPGTIVPFPRRPARVTRSAAAVAPPEPTPLRPPSPSSQPAARPAVRLGLGYVLGVRSDEVTALVGARRSDGPFRTLDDLAARAGAGRPALAQLAWSGACDTLAGGRRAALWRLGVAAAPQGMRNGDTQLALPLELPEAPPLAALHDWDAMIADYATTGLTVERHPIRLLREGLTARGIVSSAGLADLPHGARVQVGGLVVARQRPGTAKGVVFLLLEDEAGTVNVIVPPQVYERDRLTVRTEPLVVVEGVLERFASAGGAINLLVRRLAPLDAPELLGRRPRPEVQDFSSLDARELARWQAEQPRVAAAAAGGATAAHVRSGGRPTAPPSAAATTDPASASAAVSGSPKTSARPAASASSHSTASAYASETTRASASANASETTRASASANASATAPGNRPPDDVDDPPGGSLPASGDGAEDFRAVAPPIMSFAQGRRR